MRRIAAALVALSIAPALVGCSELDRYSGEFRLTVLNETNLTQEAHVLATRDGATVFDETVSIPGSADGNVTQFAIAMFTQPGDYSFIATGGGGEARTEVGFHPPSGLAAVTLWIDASENFSFVLAEAQI